MIENVQRRATQYIPGFKDLTYEERLRAIKLPTLAYRRYRGDMIEMYKLTHGEYDQQITQDFLKFNPRESRGHQYTLYKESFATNIRRNFFLNRVFDQWNNLPPKVVESTSIACFEKRLDKIWYNSDVMYNPDSNTLTQTKTRDVRCALTSKSSHDHDLMTEAS